MVSLTAAEGRRAKCEPPTLAFCLQEEKSQGVFYCYVGGPACCLWFGLKKGQTNLNDGAIFRPSSPLSINPNLLLFLFRLFIVSVNVTKPNPSQRAVSSGAPPQIHLSNPPDPITYPPPPSPPAAGFATITLSYDRNCINLTRGVCVVSAVNDPF